MSKLIRKRDFFPGTKFSYKPQVLKNGFYNIYFCGHLYLGPKHYIDRENYDLFAVIYCKKGSFGVMINDKNYVIDKEQIFCFSLDNKVIFYNYIKSITEVYLVYFQGISLVNFFSECMQNDIEMLPYKFIDELIQIVDENVSKEINDIYKFSIQSYSYLLKIHDFLSSKIKGIRKSIKLIKNKYFDKNLNLNKIAKSCGYSSYHFSRIFKNETGLSPMKYLYKERVRNGAELLKDRNLSIEKISKLVGFSDQRSFVNHFRKEYKTTPKKYQMNLIYNLNHSKQ